MRVAIISPRLPPFYCGVGDQSVQLARSLSKLGVSVSIVTSTDQLDSSNEDFKVYNIISNWGLAGHHQLKSTLQQIAPDQIIVQWVPYLYNRRGWNFMLYYVLRGVKAHVTTVVHEPWVELDNFKHVLLGPLQRASLLSLCAVSTDVVMGIQKWRRYLGPYIASEKLRCVPIGSNVPIEKLTNRQKNELKKEIGIPNDCPVVLSIAPQGTGKNIGLVAETWEQLQFHHPEVRWLIVGCDLSRVERLCGNLSSKNRIICPGFVSLKQLSHFIQLGTVCFAPFVDGISARRTSAIAAIDHGLAVVSNRGHLTDDIFTGSESPVVLAEANAKAYATALLACMANSNHFDAERSTGFSRKYFDWEKIAATLCYLDLDSKKSRVS